MDEANNFVVAIGASAGGLEAIQEFFKHMKPDSGLSFVIIQHLSPDFKSMMAELLSRHSKMEIHVAEDEMPVEPNCIYLIPPKKNMTIHDGRLHLAEQDRGQIPNLPINLFFSSMASAQKENCIAIVLSGTGTDGSRGILDVSEAGGLVIAQDPRTAKFDGMPRSALVTKAVNKALPPKDMPSFILNYTQQPEGLNNPNAKLSDFQSFSGQFQQIFKVIYEKYGINLESYKTNTIQRRIFRRIKTLMLKSVDEYINHLNESSEEIQILTQDLMIGVTSFFRDQQAFLSLKTKVIPTIFKSTNGDSVRIWVCGCSTGEEAYTIAILCEEFLEQSGTHKNYKIFASDINQDSLITAGNGIYRKELIDEFFDSDLKKKYFIQKKRKLSSFTKNKKQCCIHPT